MKLDSKFMQRAALLSFTFIPSITAHYQRTCTDYTIPVNTTSLNLIWAKPFANNYDVVDFLTDTASRTAATDFHPFSGSETQTASYQISATFCTPCNSTSNKNIVLLLSHGVNFDRRFVYLPA
jgi:hypothetical protein